jgi:hypothetical protein
MEILLNFPGIDVNRVDHVPSAVYHVTSFVTASILEAANRRPLFGADWISRGSEVALGSRGCESDTA